MQGDDTIVIPHDHNYYAILTKWLLTRSGYRLASPQPSTSEARTTSNSLRLPNFFSEPPNMNGFTATLPTYGAFALTFSCQSAIT